jgi:hypothetical protein
MSLSTQLARGAVALPLMLLFCLLGFVEAPRAENAVIAASNRAPAELLQAVCRIEGSKSRVLVLAQAPGDLGSLVVRLRAPCRA